jgi:hypothetical protein
MLLEQAIKAVKAKGQDGEANDLTILVYSVRISELTPVMRHPSRVSKIEMCERSLERKAEMADALITFDRGCWRISCSCSMFDCTRGHANGDGYVRCDTPRGLFLVSRSSERKVACL